MNKFLTMLQLFDKMVLRYYTGGCYDKELEVTAGREGLVTAESG